MTKPRSVREILEFYIAYRDENGDVDFEMTKKQVSSALKEIEGLMPSEFKIAHILSGTEGVGAYTPQQLEIAYAIKALITKKMGGKG